VVQAHQLNSAYLGYRKDHPNPATAPYFSILRSVNTIEHFSHEEVQEEVNRIGCCEAAALHPTPGLFKTLSNLRRQLAQTFDP
jgi:hypothetical protein